MKALVICHEATVGAGFVESRLRERGFDVTLHTVLPDPSQPDQPTPFPDHRDYDVVVAMGSAHAVYDTDTIGSWINDELQLIRDAHGANTPVLGVCFGGQALAAALGGQARKADVTELGWFEIEPLVDNPPFPIGPWLEWHHDCFTPPPGAELLARTPDAPQLFRVGRSLGTQFHPEINLELVSDWLSWAPDEYLAEYGQTREAIRASVEQHEADNRVNCYALVDWFLDEVAGLKGART